MKKIPVLAAAVILGLAVMGGCAGKKLYIYNWTYYTPPSVIEKFEKEYGVKVIYDEFASNEEMYAKLQAGGSGYDIIFPSGDYVSIMINQGMLERLDKTKFSNLGNVDPLVLQKATYDPAMEYSVPYYWGAAGIVVNTAKVPNFEKSWSIFSRTDLKDRMTMLDDMREVLGDALVFLGHSVNTKDPEELKQAQDLVNNSWRPNLVKFDSEAFGKGYANGDFWVVQGYAEVVYEEIAGDQELIENTVFFIPPNGGPAYIDSLCILKGARNIDLAYKFIDFIHRPEIYAEFTDFFGFPASANAAAGAYKKEKPLYSVEDMVNTELKDDLGETLEMYNAAWETIKVGN
ncbi:MAG: extracellular solute-binding protein [Spirochaetaceae bacterium]|jgi:spermidine/putrescine transport system substrate-binding protein|nr:extracellular solute-binding protein [Spirochaetaceae bacterium]